MGDAKGRHPGSSEKVIGSRRRGRFCLLAVSPCLEWCLPLSIQQTFVGQMNKQTIVGSRTVLDKEITGRALEGN